MYIYKKSVFFVLKIPGKSDLEAESCIPCPPTGRNAMHQWRFHTQRSSVLPHCKQNPQDSSEKQKILHY